MGFKSRKHIGLVFALLAVALSIIACTYYGPWRGSQSGSAALADLCPFR